MDLPSSFTALIDEMAGGKRRRTWLAVQLGRTYWQVNYWAKINNIPVQFWNDVISLASNQKMEGVNWEYLISLRKKGRRKNLARA
jgi:hypothetical protein